MSEPPAWENLDDFFQVDDDGGFARPAAILLANGTTINVRGIFDDATVNAHTGEYEHDTSDPRFTCKASAVVDVRRGDELTLDGTTYDVMTSPHQDGTGLATIKLAPR